MFEDVHGYCKPQSSEGCGAFSMASLCTVAARIGQSVEGFYG